MIFWLFKIASSLYSGSLFRLRSLLPSKIVRIMEFELLSIDCQRELYLMRAS
jgi:hypothetical protein